MNGTEQAVPAFNPLHRDQRNLLLQLFLTIFEMRRPEFGGKQSGTRTKEKLWSWFEMVRVRLDVFFQL